jgi:uncharacterized protein YerC
MKRRMHELSEKERIATLDALYTAASSVKGRASMKLFLRDLLTESERVMLGRRIIIARLLIQGESYGNICARLGTSPATIQRVQKWLADQLPGYEIAVAGIEKEGRKRALSQSQGATAIARLKKRYPLHFLLFPASVPTPKRN